MLRRKSTTSRCALVMATVLATGSSHLLALEVEQGPTVQIDESINSVRFEYDRSGNFVPVTVNGMPYKRCGTPEINECEALVPEKTGGSTDSGILASASDGKCSTVTVCSNGVCYTYADPNDPDCA